ncbi:MAG: hypothetical protein QXP01_00220 [Candidatus Hadarchaeum sp.]
MAPYNSGTMRALTSRVCAVLLAATLIMPVVWAGEPVTLRYRWQPGETLEYLIAANLEGATREGGARVVILRARTEMPITLRTLSVGVTGVATIQVACERITVSVEMLGQMVNLSVDARGVKGDLNGAPLSRKVMADLEPELTELQKLVRQSFVVRLDARGTMADSPLGCADQVRQLLPLIDLPELPVREGDSFVSRARFDGPYAGVGGTAGALSRYVQDVTYLLKAIEGEVDNCWAVVESQQNSTLGRMRLEGGSEVDVTLSMRSSGRFDIGNGRLQSEQLTATFTARPLRSRESPFEVVVRREIALCGGKNGGGSASRNN